MNKLANTPFQMGPTNMIYYGVLTTKKGMQDQIHTLQYN